MKKIYGILSVTAIAGMLLMGCAKTTQDSVYENQTPTTDNVQGIAVGEPNPSAPDQNVTLPVDEVPATDGSAPADDSTMATSPKLDEDAARAMQFSKTIEGIKHITLTDLEGNVIDRSFSDEEIASIQQAFNDSYIMDTAYIEMIAGNTMTIDLEDGRSVFIHSYGDENFIVASFSDGESYHLGCELIGKLLLEQ